MQLDRPDSSGLFQTMRLRYAPLAVEDAADLFLLLADPAVYRHIDARLPTSIDDLAARFERVRAGPPPDRKEESWWNFTVRLLESGAAIGRLEATVVGDRAEVAYLFGPAYWGKGYATEALTWLHDQLRACAAVNTFWATVRPENSRSIRLLHRTGYVEVNQWPALLSYDSGDKVYRRDAAEA